jgi:hypothetical protein
LKYATVDGISRREYRDPSKEFAAYSQCEANPHIRQAALGKDNQVIHSFDRDADTKRQRAEIDARRTHSSHDCHQ